MVVSIVDGDRSETINSILLSSLPNGFLVYVGDSAALASNAGGTNTWVISNPDGSLPAKVTIVPPSIGAERSIISPSSSRAARRRSATESSRELRPRRCYRQSGGRRREFIGDQHVRFGNQIIPLNLNAWMVDAADASVPGAIDSNQETTTLKLTGLGGSASFYIGTQQKVSGLSYGARTDTYTLTGLTQSELDQLGFLQARNTLKDQDGAFSGVQIAVEAFTTDGPSTSASDTSHLTVNAFA